MRIAARPIKSHAVSKRTSSSRPTFVRGSTTPASLDFALALLSGVLLAFSFPKFGHPAFAWIALAPLLLALVRQRTPSRRALILGLVTGAIYFSGTLYWLVETMTTFGGLATPLAMLAAAMLIAYLSLFPGAFAVIQARLLRSFGIWSLLLAPVVWVATEMGRTYVLDGFPWELLGYSQATVLPIAQLASVVGIYGLSGCVALVSAAAAFVAVDRTPRRWRVGAAVAVLILGLGLWGALRIRGSALTRAGSPIRVAVLQGNILQDQKWDPRMRGAILDRYIGMTREAIGRNAQFVLWPESSMPDLYEADMAGGEAIRRLARQAKITLLIGSDQMEPVKAVPLRKPPAPHYYNAAYLIEPDGST